MSSIQRPSSDYSCDCYDLCNQGIGRSEPLEELLAEAILDDVEEDCLERENLKHIAKLISSMKSAKSDKKETPLAFKLCKFKEEHCAEVVQLLETLSEKIAGKAFDETTAIHLTAVQLALADKIHRIASRIQKRAPNFLGNLVVARKVPAVFSPNPAPPQKPTEEFVLV